MVRLQQGERLAEYRLFIIPVELLQHRVCFRPEVGVMLALRLLQGDGSVHVCLGQEDRERMEHIPVPELPLHREPVGDVDLPQPGLLEHLPAEGILDALSGLQAALGELPSLPGGAPVQDQEVGAAVLVVDDGAHAGPGRDLHAAAGRGMVFKDCCNRQAPHPLYKPAVFIKGRRFFCLYKLGGKAMKQKQIQRDIKVLNIVASGSVGMDLNLNVLAMKLDNTEYEPEQFPGLVYKLAVEPDKGRAFKSTFLLFSNGKVVCTGTKSEREVHAALDKLILNLKKVMKK